MTRTTSTRVQRIGMVFLLLATIPASMRVAAHTADRKLRLVTGNGFGDTANYGVTVMAVGGVCNKYLFAATANNSGTRCYRSSDGNTWTLIASTPGYGGNNPSYNTRTSSMVWFNGLLFVGTHASSGGAAVFSANADQTTVTWTEVSLVGGSKGFGNTDNQGVSGMAVFNGKIYASTHNTATGPEVWTSPTGAAGSWERANVNGFGESDTSDAKLFSDGTYLYAMTANERGDTGARAGGDVFRYDGSSTPWTMVNSRGFGDSDNTAVWAMGLLKGVLYAGTVNAKGTEVWAATAGAATPYVWTMVIDNGFYKNATNNPRVDDAVVDGGVLYLGGYGTGSAGHGLVARTSDGDTWGMPLYHHEFNKAPMYGVRSLATFGDRIYLGCESAPASGAQLWVYEPM